MKSTQNGLHRAAPLHNLRFKHGLAVRARKDSSMIRQTYELQGRIAFVTGAASGIGAAIAQRFASAGARIAIIALPGDDRATQTLANVREAGSSGHIITADVSDEVCVDAAFRQTRETLGSPTILINDAGIDALGKNVADMTLHEWEQALRTNLTGPFLCTRAFLRGLSEDGAGAKIINISSVHEEIPRAGAAEYCASKGGIA